MISIFTDLTERSPTFGLNPIDVIGTFPKRSWIAMFTNADSTSKAWLKFLGRPFKGLAKDVFERPFEGIPDDDLRMRALNSLKNAGPDQQALYDFSFSEDNRRDHPIEEGDLALLALLPHELDGELREGTMVVDYLKHVTGHKAKVVVLLLTYGEALPSEHASLRLISTVSPDALVIQVPLASLPSQSADPLNIRAEIAIKMLMNAHSTAVMTRMGRVVGNTMSNVRAGNLKLIGRATYLIKMHVDDVVKRGWKTLGLASPDPISLRYEEANAVLFDTLDYLTSFEERTQESPVPISIIRVIESIRHNRFVEVSEADGVYAEWGLEKYLYNWIG